MSVALLSGDKTIEVCDELEAFTHLIIYLAARYLDSKCDGTAIAMFLDAFFDTYSWNGWRWVCGDKKRSTINSGILDIATYKRISFGDPMDAILSKLLSWFKAQSSVTEYDSTPKEQPKPIA